MIIRNINYDEVDKYCRVGLEEKRALEFKERILKAWEEKRSYPEWFFVIEEDGEFTGRLGFDIFPSEPLNLMVWGLVIPDEKDYLEVGEKLFRGALDYFDGKGFNLIEHHLYEKNNSKFNISRELYLKVGFEIHQEKFSFMFRDGKLPELSGRLVFKTIKQVGEEEFINAMIRVTEGTLDSYDARDVKRLGAYEQALESFNGLKDIDYNEEWWKLAYEPDGDFAGLILSQKFNNKVGAINYIGVAPEKRGKGYVMDLLAMGTKVLKEYGIEEIIADIDVNNYPMKNALTAAGYEYNGLETVLEKVSAK